MATFSELALLITCTYCGARPGERCRARPIETRGMSPSLRLTYATTRPATYTHSARSRPVWAIWDDGRTVGTEYARRVPSG